MNEQLKDDGVQKPNGKRVEPGSELQGVEPSAPEKKCRCNYFGVCECGGGGGVVTRNDGTHIIVCDTCKTYWLVGINLFSYWQDQSPGERQAEEKRFQSVLSGYRAIKCNDLCHDCGVLINGDCDEWGEPPGSWDCIVCTSCARKRGIPAYPRTEWQSRWEAERELDEESLF